MLGVVRYPYMPTDVDRALQHVAIEMGGEANRSTRHLWVFTSVAPVSRPRIHSSVESDRRTGCISCGNCNIGCGHNAKNKLTTNYLYLAEILGAEIHELHEVYSLVPFDGCGFEVHARHPGWAQ